MIKRIGIVLGIVFLVGISSSAYAQYFGMSDIKGFVPSITAVSEPASLLILGIVMLGLAGITRKRLKK